MRTSPALRPLQAEDGAQQHRLARTRAADDAEDLALLHGHVEMVVHHLRAEAVDETPNFDEGFSHQMSSCQNTTANSASAKNHEEDRLHDRHGSQAAELARGVAHLQAAIGAGERDQQRRTPAP